MGKFFLLLLLALVLSGCVGIHKPSQPEGPLHRVNPPQYYSDYSHLVPKPASAVSSDAQQPTFRTVRQGNTDE